MLACLKSQESELNEFRNKPTTQASPVPSGVILPLDDPAGCSKLGVGWEDAQFGGKFLVSVSSIDPRFAYRNSGGRSTITIDPGNIPPLYLGYHTAQSGPGVTLSLVEQLSFSRPNSANILQTSTVGASPIDILPPYVPVFFCKRST